MVASESWDLYTIVDYTATAFFYTNLGGLFLSISSAGMAGLLRSSYILRLQFSHFFLFVRSVTHIHGHRLDLMSRLDNRPLSRLK